MLSFSCNLPLSTTLTLFPYTTLFRSYMTDENGEPFEYPYFIHDSYDSTDIINKIDWDMATNAEAYPIHNQTREYTTGDRKSTRLNSSHVANSYAVFCFI